jgi:hypothetical protein
MTTAEFTKSELTGQVGELQRAAAHLGHQAEQLSEKKMARLNKTALEGRIVWLRSVISDLEAKASANLKDRLDDMTAAKSDADVKRPFLLTYCLEGIEATKRARFLTRSAAFAWADKHAQAGYTVVDVREADEVA